MAGVNLQKLNPEIGTDGDKEQWKATHKAVVDRYTVCERAEDENCDQITKCNVAVHVCTTQVRQKHLPAINPAGFITRLYDVWFSRAELYLSSRGQ